MEFIKYSEDKEKMKEIVEKNERYHRMEPKAVSLLKDCTKIEIKIEEEKEEINMCKAWADMAKECEERGEARGEERGRRLGEEKYANLTKDLLSENRYEDLKRAADDTEYREKLYEELGL